VLIQMPHAFLKEACKKARIALPGPGEYGCGLVFLPRDRIKRRRLEERFEQIVQSEGQTSSAGGRARRQLVRSARRPSRASR
jgi:glutamate synthase domain-containing protein 1